MYPQERADRLGMLIKLCPGVFSRVGFKCQKVILESDLADAEKELHAVSFGKSHFPPQ